MKFRILQGDCETVFRATAAPVVLTLPSPLSTSQWARSQRQLDRAGVWTYPGYLSGLVEEVMQVRVRHIYNNAQLTENAFNMQKTYWDTSNDPASLTSCSLARDGSLLKIRLPQLCKPFRDWSECFRPTSSTSGQWAVRFQLVNWSTDIQTKFLRTDTVWNAFGLPTAQSSIDSIIKMDGEWNLTPVSGLIMTLENDIGFEETHEYYTEGKRLGKVLAKVDYNAAVSRNWGVVHSRTYTARNLQEIRVRILDTKLRDYDFSGRSFTVSFNIHQF